MRFHFCDIFHSDNENVHCILSSWFEVNGTAIVAGEKINVPLPCSHCLHFNETEIQLTEYLRKHTTQIPFLQNLHMLN